MANAAKNDFNDGVYIVTFHAQMYRDICLIHPIVILKFRNIFFHDRNIANQKMGDDAINSRFRIR